MMRKIFTFSTIFMFSIAFLWAGKVDVEKALSVATNLIQSKEQLRSTSPAQLSLVYTCNEQSGLRSSDALVYYYVFNVADDKGFVIVSGDDIATPVLGYSTNGNYDRNNLPPNFEYWMECLQKEITWGIKNNITQSEETQSQWNAYLNGNVASLRATQAVAPFVQTKWNQYAPYNNLCPLIGATRTVTGCVATAMAQIMKYYNYPTTGTGSSEVYTCTAGSIPSVNLNVNYDWGNMINNYTIGTPTAAQNSAVATLMYHCGVSAKMNYDLASNGGSGASSNSAGVALATYFNYDKGIQLKQRKFYTDTDWENILKYEIDARRPVLYSGSDSQGAGHAFVCAGYDDANPRSFYFNWGWGGSYDGYFVTTLLNPGKGGAGSGSGVYNEGQSVLMNIIASPGENVTYELKLRGGQNLTSTKSSVDRGESFSVSTPFSNMGLFSFSGSIGIALLDDSGEIKEVIGTTTISDLGSWYSTTRDITCSVPTTATPSSYKIQVVAKPTGSTDWIKITGQIGYTDILNLTVKSGTLTHNMKLKSGSNLSSTKTSVDRGEGFTVSATFKNAASTTFNGAVGIGLVDNNDNVLEVIGQYGWNDISLGAGSAYTSPFNISCFVSKGITAGNYKVRAIAKPNAEENWSIVYGETGVTDILDLTVKSDVINPYIKLLSSLLTTAVSPMNVDVNFTVTMQPSNSTNIYNFAGNLAVALIDADKQVKAILYDWPNFSLNAGSSYTSALVRTCKIPSTTPSGSYNICVVAKGTATLRAINEDEWEIVGNTSSSDINMLPIVVNNPSLITSITSPSPSSFTLYPNPLKDVLYISNEDAAIKSVKIMDLSGRTLKVVTLAQPANQTNVTVSDLNAGTYLVTIQTDTETITKKIIVVR